MKWTGQKKDERKRKEENRSQQWQKQNKKEEEEEERKSWEEKRSWRLLTLLKTKESLIVTSSPLWVRESANVIVNLWPHSPHYTLQQQLKTIEREGIGMERQGRHSGMLNDKILSTHTHNTHWASSSSSSTFYHGHQHRSKFSEQGERESSLCTCCWHWCSDSTCKRKAAVLQC